MRSVLLAVAALAAAFPVGCGSSGGTAAIPSYGSPDGQKISQLVDRLNDDKSTLPMLQRLFAAGAKPSAAEGKKYPLYAFAVKGDPKVEGSTATATVEFKKEQGGADAGTKEWTFVKEGEEWRVKSAPLP